MPNLFDIFLNKVKQEKENTYLFLNDTLRRAQRRRITVKRRVIVKKCLNAIMLFRITLHKIKFHFKLTRHKEINLI